MSRSEPAKTFSAKIFPTHAFGYRRITIERPLRLSWQFSDDRLASLRFAPGILAAPMEWIYQTHGAALKSAGIKLDATEKRQIQTAVSWKNPAAAKVIKNVHKTGKPDPFYGKFPEWNRHSCLSSPNSTT